MIKNEVYSCFRKMFLMATFLLLAGLPAFAEETLTEITLEAAGTLEAVVGDNKNTITKLKVYGEINSADLALLKTMATTGTLSVLDLSEVAATSVDLIGTEAFRRCRNLTSISLPQNVTSIGNGAFYNCKNLKSVTIPNSVKSIGNSAFYDCTDLTSVIIPDSVTNIGNNTFYNCSAITSVTIGSSVTSIGNSAFGFCKGLTSVTIPNEVTSIDDYAFNACTGLTSITFGSSVTSIGDNVFYECTSLTSVTIPNSVKSIGNETFSCCSSLEYITIGKSVTSIGKRVFYGCTKLKEVTLRGKVLPTCEANVFDYVDLSNVKLYCRKVLLDKWEDKAPWSSFLEDNRIAKPFIVTIPAGGYATGCFYDDLDFTEKKDVAAYIVSAFSPNESTVLLTRAKKIPAETGFIVTGIVGTEYTIPAATINYVYSNMLVSVLDKTTLSQTEGDYTNYTLHRNTKDNTVAFIRVDAEGEDVSGYKAYLQIPTSAVSASSGASGSDAKTTLSLSFDDDEDDGTTDISEIKEQHDRTSGTTIIYNLNGQRKQSLTKGLNIVNGKKIFVK